MVKLLSARKLALRDVQGILIRNALGPESNIGTKLRRLAALITAEIRMALYHYCLVNLV